MKTRTASLAFAFAAAFLACPAAQARQVKNSADVVKATATAGPVEGGKQTVTVHLKIDKPYHIYANPVGNEDLADVQTLLTVKGKAKPGAVKVTYPEGKEHTSSGITYRVYEGEVTLKAEVQRAPDDTGPLQLEVYVQSCTDTRCLLPGTIKLTVK